MATIWDWLIERERKKHMMQWRRSVDQAETMTLRIASKYFQDNGSITLTRYVELFSAIVDLHRREPGREVDLEKAEEAANRVLGELREIS